MGPCGHQRRPGDRAAPTVVLEEGGDGGGVELASRLAREHVECLLVLRGLAVGTARGDGIERVRDRDDACTDGNLLPAQSGGIAGAVEALVVMADHRRDLRVLDPHQHVGAVAGVSLHQRELRVGEPAGLVEDVPRRVDLADVVQRGGGAHLGDVRRRQPHLAGDALRMPGHPSGVAVSVRVPGLELRAQPRQRLDAVLTGHPRTEAEHLMRPRQAPLGPQPSQPSQSIRSAKTTHRDAGRRIPAPPQLAAPSEAGSPAAPTRAATPADPRGPSPTTTAGSTITNAVDRTASGR